MRAVILNRKRHYPQNGKIRSWMDFMMMRSELGQSFLNTMVTKGKTRRGRDIRMRDEWKSKVEVMKKIPATDARI